MGLLNETVNESSVRFRTSDRAAQSSIAAGPEEMVMAAQAAHQNGNPEQAAALYEMAVDHLSTTAARYGALLGLAGAYCDSGRLDLAESACRRAVEEYSVLHAGHAMLASVLLDLGRVVEAADAATEALIRAPGNVILLNLATGIALRRGRAEEARMLAETALAYAPNNQRALAHLAIAEAQLGLEQEVAHLLDFDRLLEVRTIAAPAGFESVEAFNAALIEGLTTRPDLSYRHTARTMVGGARLEDTFALEPRLSSALHRVFADAAEDYVSKLAVDDDHPVAAGRPESFAIQSWSNIMESAAYELPHIHEGGWLSGVYYPEVSIARTGDSSDAGGAIEFGGHDFGDALVHAGPTKRVMPQPGMLVLFPAYFYHRTIPFAGKGRRISIAYDAKPVQSAG
jgi:tetratricopeptide (TPR) repeat protein